MLKSLFFVLLNREAVRKNFFKLPAIGQKKKKKSEKEKQRNNARRKRANSSAVFI